MYNGAPVRKDQVQLALDVGDFLYNSEKKFLFIDAPVGIGKSMGVLIPTLMYSKNNFKSVLYATATISLQDQIMNRDQLNIWEKRYGMSSVCDISLVF